MEIKLQCGDKIAIPTGCKAIVSEGYVFVEAITPEFKIGDFIACEEDGRLAKTIVIASGFDYPAAQVVGFVRSNVYFDCKISGYKDFRHATPEERTQLLEAMHAASKDWDFEKQEVVDWEWRPKIGEQYFCVAWDEIIGYTWNGSETDSIHLCSNVIFRTRELAEEALEMLKQCKHY